MLRLAAVYALLLMSPVAMSEAAVPAALDFTVQTLGGENVVLSDKYADKVVLLVNVASKCGYTKQYEGLQTLHDKYADQGLAIVGVPCNQFGGQEPGAAEEIASFCKKNYGVEFDMLSKVNVNAPDQCELYAYLTTDSPQPGPIGWNFEKFLLSRGGEVVGRYKSGVEPTGPELTADIERELAE